jgi:hypothetical protein
MENPTQPLECRRCPGDTVSFDMVELEPQPGLEGRQADLSPAGFRLKLTTN